MRTAILAAAFACLHSVHAANAQSRTSDEFNSSVCGFPGYRVDMDRIYAAAEPYPNGKVLFLTSKAEADLRRQYQEMNAAGASPMKMLSPCMTCSPERSACIAYDGPRQRQAPPQQPRPEQFHSDSTPDRPPPAGDPDICAKSPQSYTCLHGHPGRSASRDESRRGTEVQRQYRLTIKSYIARIGDRIGMLPGPSGRDPIAMNALRALALATDAAFNENPRSEDSQEGQYRLYTHVGVVVTCRAGQVVRQEVGQVRSDVGTEPGRPVVPGAALFPEPMRITAHPVQRVDGGRGVKLGYFGKAHPHWLAEPALQTIAPRRATDIWHELAVVIVCGPDGPQVDYRRTTLRGSRFPSHRLWINLQLVRTIDQGSMADLWVSDPEMPDRIR